VEAGPATALLALADRALVTGAPLLASIDGYATSLRRDERAAAVEKARRLPVKLLFPLALLILPGFLLLTVGPALLAGLDRLGL
jgi:tight adherence protein C